MQKLDLKQQLKHLYRPSAKGVSLAEVPALQFVMLDGRLAADETPADSTVFQDGVAALYGLSYALKFMSKKRSENPIDYSVMPLEGLWWTDSGRFDFNRREPWSYTLMMLQPAHITRDMFLEAQQEQARKKPSPVMASLRLEPFHEGLSMQILHLGPYADEPRTLARMEAFAAEHGYAYRGSHHEIYLGDPRRAQPEKLQTILRQPVEPVDHMR